MARWNNLFDYTSIPRECSYDKLNHHKAHGWYYIIKFLLLVFKYSKFEFCKFSWFYVKINNPNCLFIHICGTQWIIFVALISYFCIHWARVENTLQCLDNKMNICFWNQIIFSTVYINSKWGVPYVLLQCTCRNIRHCKCREWVHFYSMVEVTDCGKPKSFILYIHLYTCKM